MTAGLLKVLAWLVPASMLFSGAAVVFFGARALCSFLQLLGAACLVVVVLTHVCEALHGFSRMHWAEEHSVGHYLDFSSVLLELTPFPTGYLLCAIRAHAAERLEE
jgi:hypothetical protein